MKVETEEKSRSRKIKVAGRVKWEKELVEGRQDMQSL